MVFSSLIFIYAFLPLQMLLYALSKNTTVRNTVLLIFSLVFYAWGEPVYVLILIGMTLCDWVAALLIQNTAKSARSKKLVLIVACIINLGLIGFFKYTGFFLVNLKAVAGIPDIIPQIALPIGISFYTFQLLSYVVDVYREEVKAQKNFFWLLLYASLFYQCIAGPIVRYSDVDREITKRRADWNDIADGITRFTVGLAKKALIANLCGSLSDSLLVADSLLTTPDGVLSAASEIGARSVLGVWFGVLFYMLQIYLDFSAYSDMAIGMGRMVGFHFKENFNYPYIAKSVTDFWRRWHISLSSFFRDYVYIPLGGNRHGKFRTYRNILIVWLLTGFWHGASWNFVLWGLYFCIFLILEKVGFLKVLDKIPAVFSHLYLLLVVFFGWILFRFRDFSLIPVVLGSLFGVSGNPLTDFETLTLLKGNAFFLIVAVLSVTPVVPVLTKAISQRCRTERSKALFHAASALAPVALLVLSSLSLVGDSYNPFLYFQF